jgi:hypothetical protein
MAFWVAALVGVALLWPATGRAAPEADQALRGSASQSAIAVTLTASGTSVAPGTEVVLTATASAQVADWALWDLQFVNVTLSEVGRTCTDELSCTTSVVAQPGVSHSFVARAKARFNPSPERTVDSAPVTVTWQLPAQATLTPLPPAPTAIPGGACWSRGPQESASHNRWPSTRSFTLSATGLTASDDGSAPREGNLVLRPKPLPAPIDASVSWTLPPERYCEGEHLRIVVSGAGDPEFVDSVSVQLSAKATVEELLTANSDFREIATIDSWHRLADGSALQTDVLIPDFWLSPGASFRIDMIAQSREGGDSFEVVSSWRYSPAAAEPETAATAADDDSAKPGSDALTVEVLALTGDVSYIPAGSESARPLSGDVVLQPGDTILTGFDSGGSFRIGQNRLDLPPATALRIDEYLADENIERTRLFINVGAVRVNVRHTPSIRSDFSVQTPTSNSSARGTEFIVSVDEDGASTTYVLDGTVSVQAAEGEAMDVAAGNKAFVASAAAIAAPEPYEPGELPAFLDGQASGASSLSPIAIGGIALAGVLVLVVVVAVMRQRRRGRASS